MEGDYLEFKIKKFRQETTLFVMKVALVTALGLSFIVGFAMPTEGLLMVLAAAGLVSLVVVVAVYITSSIVQLNTIFFLKELAHEEAERIRNS